MGVRRRQMPRRLGGIRTLHCPKRFDLRKAGPEHEPSIARLVVEGMWYLYGPIFRGRYASAVDLMRRMIAFEQSIAGVHTMVAETDAGVVGTAAVYITGSGDEAPKVDRSQLRDLRRAMRGHLGLFGALRTAVLLSYPRYKPQASEAYAACFVIAEGHRHLGIAPELFGAIEQIGRDAQKETMGSFTRGDDRRLLRLYRSWGYSEAGRQRSFIARRALGISEFVYLRKQLRGPREPGAPENTTPLPSEQVRGASDRKERTR